ncbi:MAG: GyrI-like domain-containing protein [Burkholderiaceae bacterium]
MVQYIYDHLEEDISIDRLAEVACLSPYHWHRIYTAMRGETVATTVKRLRLLRAADRLANTNQPILEIAQLAGYEALASFGRAFKAVYKQSPAEYRAGGTHAAFKAALAAKDTDGFPVEIVEIEPLFCAGVAHTGPYITVDQAIGKLFGALGSQRMIPNPPRMLAQFIDDPDAVDAEQLRSVACVPMDAELAGSTDLPAPAKAVTLRGGAYAQLTYKGPYADMKDAYRWFYGVWLPASGLEPANAPAIEEYLNNPQEVAPADLLTHINVPVEAI